MIVFVFMVLVGICDWLNFNKDEAVLVSKLDNLTTVYSLLQVEPAATNRRKNQIH